jgi:hypothetical protein
MFLCCAARKDLQTTFNGTPSSVAKCDFKIGAARAIIRDNAPIVGFFSQLKTERSSQWVDEHIFV